VQLAIEVRRTSFEPPNTNFQLPHFLTQVFFERFARRGLMEEALPMFLVLSPHAPNLSLEAFDGLPDLGLVAGPLCQKRLDVLSSILRLFLNGRLGFLHFPLGGCRQAQGCLSSVLKILSQRCLGVLACALLSTELLYVGFMALGSRRLSAFTRMTLRNNLASEFHLAPSVLLNHLAELADLAFHGGG
jgi:hypothetical protein